jgi:hypothetical protein
MTTPVQVILAAVQQPKGPENLISQIGLIVGAVATLLGVVVTTRASRSSNARTAVLNEIPASRDSGRADAESLRTRLNEDSRRNEDEMQEINARIDRLIREHRRDRDQWANESFTLQSRINEITLWCRRIAPILAESGRPVPPAPPGLLVNQTDPNLRRLEGTHDGD